MFEATCVAPTSCLLGLSPIWSPTEGFLWWVDPHRAKLHRYNPKTGNARRYDLPIRATAIAISEGRLLLIGGDTYGLYDQATEAFDRLGNLPSFPDKARTNDGGMAPDGSFWFGTCDSDGLDPIGEYFCLRPGGGVEPMRLDPVPMTYGFGFSPDGSVFYTSDTAAQEILAFDHDIKSGILTERRVFASTLHNGCYPDGLAVDADGYVWSTHWAGSKVVRYRPDGAIEQAVQLPVSRPTGLAFGGEDLKTLFVTTARSGLSNAALDRQTMAGCLFSIETPVSGQKISQWNRRN